MIHIKVYAHMLKCWNKMKIYCVRFSKPKIQNEKKKKHQQQKVNVLLLSSGAFVMTSCFFHLNDNGIVYSDYV